MFANTHFAKATKFWYNGSLHDWNEAVLHTATHALHYGTCVFEGIRAYKTPKGPAVFRLPEHIDRFFYSSSVVMMKFSYSKEDVTKAIMDTIRGNGLDSCYIRPLLFYSYGNLGLYPKAAPVEMTVIAWEWPAYLGDSRDLGAHAYIVPWRRVHHTQFQAGAKLGGLYIQSTISGLEAKAHGCDEAMFLNLEGRVSEGPGENIFIVKGRTVKTNDGPESILEGITRRSILEIAGSLGYKTKVGPISKKEFFGADEAFFSGTAVEITPVVKVTDGSDSKHIAEPRLIGDGKPGKTTLELAAKYREAVSGKLPEYEKWLTYVK